MIQLKLLEPRLTVVHLIINVAYLICALVLEFNPTAIIVSEVAVVLSTILGNDDTKKLDNLLRKAVNILKNPKLTLEQKLNGILNVMIECGILAGKIFEDLQATDKYQTEKWGEPLLP